MNECMVRRWVVRYDKAVCIGNVLNYSCQRGNCDLPCHQERPLELYGLSILDSGIEFESSSVGLYSEQCRRSVLCFWALDTI